MRKRKMKRGLAYLLCMALVFESTGISVLAEETQVVVAGEAQAAVVDEPVVSSGDAVSNNNIISEGDVSGSEVSGDIVSVGNAPEENGDVEVAVSEGNADASDVGENNIVGGDVSDNIVDENVEIETVSENSVVVLNETTTENIASGTYYGMDWVIDGNGLLTISGTYSGSLSTIDESWHGYSESIIQAKVTATEVTSTGSWFNGLTKLQSVNFDEFDTSKVTNMHYMFADCSSLTNVDLSKLNTTSVVSMSHMFSGCSGLTSLNLDSFNTNQVTSTEAMFEDCKGLTSLDLSMLNTSQVVGMNSMFSGCSGLVELNLSGIKTECVDNMSYMFEDCSSLTSLDLSMFNTSQVTNMDSMFSGCSGLISLDLSSFDASLVTDMDDMFEDCSGLTSLDLSKLNAQGVRLAYTFRGCTGLTSLDLSGFDMTGQSDGAYEDRYFLKDCTNLETLVTPKNLNMDVELALPGIFVDDEGEVYATIPQNLSVSISLRKTAALSDYGIWRGMYWAEGADGNLIIAGAYDASGGGSKWSFKNEKAKVIATGVTSTADWFAYCSSLQSIDWNGFDFGQVTDASGMFSGCTSLLEIDLEGIDTSRVINMESMFGGCKSLKILDLSGFDMNSVTDATNMLQGCSGLETIVVPAEVNVATFLPGIYTDANGKIMVEMPRNNESVTELSRKAETVAVTSERGLYWVIDKEGLLYITGNYVEDPEYPNFYPGWKSYDEEVTEVILTASGVTSTANWFYYMYNMQSIDLSAFDASKVTDMSHMFERCLKLKTIKLGTIDTGKVTDMSYMFSNCDALTDLDLSGLDVGLVTNMSYMFSECDNLVNLNLSGLNAGQVLDMSYMFSYCESLNNLNLKDIDTSQVTNMCCMFQSCRVLPSLDVSSLDTGNVTNMSGMFMMCYDLASIDLSGFDTSKVTDMRSMFDMTAVVYEPGDEEDTISKLKDINLSGFKTDQVTDMSSMFYGCNVSSLDLSHFNTSNVTDMSYMFYDCYELTDLNVSGFITSKVTNMSNMFNGCCNLDGVDLKGFNTLQVTDMSYMFSYCGSLKELELDLSSFYTDNVTTMEKMFWWSGVTKLNMSNFNTSKVTNMNSMFTWCTGLDELDLSNFDMSGIENSPSLFSNCSALKTIKTPLNLSTSVILPGCYLDENKTIYSYLPINMTESIVLQKDESLIGAGKYYGMDWVIDTNGNLTISGTYDGTDEGLSWRHLSEEIVNTKVTATGVKSTKSWFEWLSDMESIDLSGLDTSQVIDMSNMFEGCVHIGNLDLRGLDTSQVTNMSGMFEFCQSGLKSLDVSTFDTSNVTNMNYMFDFCSGLTALNLSSFDMSKVVEATDMLRDCSKLETINTPKNLGIDVVLPSTMYDENGTTYTSLPTGLSTSITLTKTIPSGDKDNNEGDTSTNDGGDDNSGDNDTNSGDDVGDDNSGDNNTDDGDDTDSDTDNDTTDGGDNEGGITEGLIVSNIPDLTYTGKAHKPIISVKQNGKLLVAGVDYTVTYKNNTNAATVDSAKAPTVIVKGKGNYTGTISVKFNILPRDLKIKTSYTQTIVAANGKVQKAKSMVWVEGKKLVANKDYTIEYPDKTDDAYKNPGTYNVVIKGMGNYQGSITIPMIILGENQIMASKLKVSKIPACTYVEGTPATPSVTVSYKGKELELGKDYAVSYINNDKAGKASLIITGLQNAEGTYVAGAAVKSFTIKGTAIKKVDMTYNTSAIYSGLEICPAVTLKDGAKTLRPDVDYTVEYTKNVNVGKGTILITGKGGYTGTVKKTFTIQADASVADKLKVTFASGKAEAAFDQKGTKPAISVTLGNTILKSGRDYTISYKNNKKLADANAAKAPTVVIKGKGNYKFNKSVTFTIVEKNLTDADISVESADKFVGGKKGYLSAPVVKDGNGKKLKANKDYKVVGYTVNGAAFDGSGEVPAGTTVIVTVEGVGNYKGQTSTTYRIANNDISKVKVNKPALEYNGGKVKFTEEMLKEGKLELTDKTTGKKLVYGTDFVVVGYKNNTRKGTATVTVQGIGEYGGTKSVKFSISSKTLK